MSKIRFGTSGWRGILGENFTFDHVRVVTQAIADHLRAGGIHDRGIIVGYDARFMGDRFARESVRILAGAGIKSFLCDRDTPTPVISFEILRRRTAGGINFTASHNSYDYNGVKFLSAWGGLALPETTRDIETRANAMLGEFCFKELPLDQAFRAGLVEEIDPRGAYIQRLRSLIDLKAIAESGMTIAVNPLYGSGRGYLDVLLREAGVKVVVMNNHPDPYFGGLPPEPSEKSMGDFIALVKGNDAISLGLATDGDADRYGIVDADGTFVEPNLVLALLFDYLVRNKKERGDVARSVATSHFVDAVARLHGLNVLETPVGFKFIGEYIHHNRILIGGEESAGLTLRGHVPDKDGILACLLVAEMVAVEGRSIRKLLADLYRRVGEFHTSRKNIHLSSQLEKVFSGKLKNLPQIMAGRKVAKVVTMDGCKLIFEDGSWVLFRKSGTEPVVRVYAEAGDSSALAELISEASAFVIG